MQQYKVLKFNSTRLNEFDYDIQIDIDKAKRTKELIQLADTQMLKKIRELSGQDLSFDDITKLFEVKKSILKKKKIDRRKLRQINEKIDKAIFIKDYITIEIQEEQHRNYLYKNGVKINGEVFRRFSSSASQARVSTAVFVNEKTMYELWEILNCGRNQKVKLGKAKFNAYFGLNSSTLLEIPMPRYCVVDDCFRKDNIKVNWVTQTDKDDDDLMEVKEVEHEYNLFDGEGMISPQYAEKISKDLNIGYIPACLRIVAPWIKGMDFVMDFVEFATEINDGNYIITDIYGEQFDVRELDMILTKSQFKLWDCYDNQKDYNDNLEKYGLSFGISIYSPKEDKNSLKMNYQFLQTLNLNQEKIEKLCNPTIEHFKNICGDDIYNTILFLFGGRIDEDSLDKFFKNSNNHWLKSLIVDNDIINDKYVSNKIKNSLKTKIDNTKFGEIFVRGNFSVLISDPYAFCQHIFGQEVTGLLNTKEYYSRYWNDRNVNLVNSMRSPLTGYSEHLLLNLVKKHQTEKWYKHIYSGIICNIYDDHTIRWAGSDWDYDIIATTDDEVVISSTYVDELPVLYEPPKVKKEIIKLNKLGAVDKFVASSNIGGTTNTYTAMKALMADIRDVYGEDSIEYETLNNRFRAAPVFQNRQIDKGKIGQAVKEIPKRYLKYQPIKDDDDIEIVKRKDLDNKIFVDKKPYFFIYIYPQVKSDYTQYYKKNNASCANKFNMSLDELLKKDNKTDEQIEFCENFNKYSPVYMGNCEMNMICKYMEQFSDEMKVFNSDIEFDWGVYLNPNVNFYDNEYEKTIKAVEETMKEISLMNKNSLIATSGKFDKDIGSKIDNNNTVFEDNLNNLCINRYRLVNYLVKIFYENHNSYNKSLLWDNYGDIVFENVLNKSDNEAKIPIRDKNGSLQYKYDNYEIVEVKYLKEKIYNEKEFAEQMLINGFLLKNKHLYELQVLTKYYNNVMGLDKAEIKEKLKDFCSKYYEGYMLEIHYKLINKALDIGMRKDNILLELDNVVVEKCEIDYILGLDIEDDLKELLFSMLASGKIDKKFAEVKEYKVNDMLSINAVDNYKSLKERITMPNNYKLLSKIKLLKTLGLIKETDNNNGRVNLTFIENINYGDNKINYTIDKKYFKDLNLWYRLNILLDSKIKHCEMCGELIIDNTKLSSRKYCNKCAKVWKY